LEVRLNLKNSQIGGKKRKRLHSRSAFAYSGMIVAALYSAWPLAIMALEGYDIDLSPLFSGRGVRLVGGVPYYSGGIFPNPIHYLNALTLGGFPRLVGNSLAIALISIGIALSVGIPVAYVMARIDLRGKNFVAYTLLALRALSPFVVIIPLYITYSRIGLFDTYSGVALAEEMLILTVVVWMVRGFFADIPREIYDAALVFGKTDWQIFRRVALPMVLPGIAVCSLFALVLIWNEFLIAQTLTGPATKTVAVGVWSGMSESSVSFKSLAWDELNAGGTLAFVPAVAVMLFIRKYLAKGFSLGTAQ
jgi:multiple sugar transport system permease protein